MSKFKPIPKGERPFLYRYGWESGVYGEVSVYCQRYVAYAETEVCFYIIEDRHERQVDSPHSWDQHWVKRYRRRVLKSQEGKRYAYIDQKQALRSYVRRKEVHLSFALAALERAKAGMQAAKQALESGILLDSSDHLRTPCEFFEGWSRCSLPRSTFVLRPAVTPLPSIHCRDMAAKDLPWAKQSS